jgi:hypothetical protein
MAGLRRRAAQIKMGINGWHGSDRPDDWPQTLPADAGLNYLPASLRPKQFGEGRVREHQIGIVLQRLVVIALTSVN